MNLTHAGTAAYGTLRVFNGTASDSSLAAGLYPVFGGFADPVTFNVQNQNVGDNKFTLSGNLPRGFSNGDFNFSIGKVSQNGILSAQGEVNAANPFAVNADLRFSDFTARGPLNQLSDYPFDLAPITPTGAGAFNDPVTSAFNNGAFGYSVYNNVLYQGLRVQGARTDRANQRRNARVTIEVNPHLTGKPFLLSVGQTFDLKIPISDNADYDATVSVAFGDLSGFNYQSIAGKLTIKSITSEAINFELSNVKVANSNAFPTSPSVNISGFPNDGQPISSFIVNGNFASSGLPSSVGDLPK